MAQIVYIIKSSYCHVPKCIDTDSSIQEALTYERDLTIHTSDISTSSVPCTHPSFRIYVGL